MPVVMFHLRNVGFIYLFIFFLNVEFTYNGIFTHNYRQRIFSVMKVPKMLLSHTDGSRVQMMRVTSFPYGTPLFRKKSQNSFYYLYKNE